MLNNILSTFFIKNVLTLLEDKRKLDLIKYNKKLQHLINVDIITFRMFSEKYCIFETNTKIEEYDTNSDSLLFIGEYLNGKRNGKGKEYEGKHNLIFDGDYLNGKRN